MIGNSSPPNPLPVSFLARTVHPARWGRGVSKTRLLKAGVAGSTFFLGAAIALWMMLLLSGTLSVWGVLLAGGGLAVMAAGIGVTAVRLHQDDVRMGRDVNIEQFMAATPAPLVLIDGTLHAVLKTNAAAQVFFDHPTPNTAITKLIDAADLPQIMSACMETGLSATIDFEHKGVEGPAFRAHFSRLENKTILVFIEDMSMAYRLDKMRSDFIANVSHELRTPLTAIIGYVETLQGHARDDEAVKDKFLEMMHAQAQRMLRLVRDLMSLSKIELDETRAPTETVDLAEITREVVDSLDPVIDHYNGVVTIVMPGEDSTRPSVKIIGVRDELIQVIQNLLDNALKYAGDTPKIEVTIGVGCAPCLGEGSTRAGERAALLGSQSVIPPEVLVYVQIKDNGRGVNRADLPRLTERFYRVNVEKSRMRGGTGLGLAIVKHVINRHRGALQIETLEGVGTAFTCYFSPADRSGDMERFEEVLSTPPRV